MFGILIDTTRCTACESCVYACGREHDVDSQQIIKEKALNKEGLSAYRPTSIVKVDEGRFAKKSCFHCVEPSCVSACLVGGITKSPEGPVIYDPEKCIGCRYCMLACPFGVPKYEWDKVTPVMVKCDMCFDRLEGGKKPACVEACPNEVLRFGHRSNLIKEARARIKNAPEKYIDHIWGEKEFGGTSVLYISDTDLIKLGWPDEILRSIPSLTEPLVHKTPFIGMSVAAGLVGINWIIKRRNELARKREIEIPGREKSKKEEGDE